MPWKVMSLVDSKGGNQMLPKGSQKYQRIIFQRGLRPFDSQQSSALNLLRAFNGPKTPATGGFSFQHSQNPIIKLSTPPPLYQPLDAFVIKQLIIHLDLLTVSLPLASFEKFDPAHDMSHFWCICIILMFMYNLNCHI